MHFWMSFVNKDGDNQGCCIVEAANLDGAIRTAWAEGCNPGGAVSIAELPDDVATEEIGRWGTNVLIRPEDLRAANYMSTRQH